MSGCLARYHSELTRLPGEDGIEYGPRYCTSLAATRYRSGYDRRGLGLWRRGGTGRKSEAKRAGFTTREAKRVVLAEDGSRLQGRDEGS